MELALPKAQALLVSVQPDGWACFVTCSAVRMIAMARGCVFRATAFAARDGLALHVCISGVQTTALVPAFAFQASAAARLVMQAIIAPRSSLRVCPSA